VDLLGVSSKLVPRGGCWDLSGCGDHGWDVKLRGTHLLRAGAMKRYVAELVGTFIRVFGGCGSVVLAGDKIGFAEVSFAFGISLLAMVYAIGPVSGCHLNPAVRMGLLLAKTVQARFAAGYLVVQVVGAILATGVLSLIAKGGPPL
jgi:aquaporin Z